MAKNTVQFQQGFSLQEIGKPQKKMGKSAAQKQLEWKMMSVWYVTLT